MKIKYIFIGILLFYKLNINLVACCILLNGNIEGKCIKKISIESEISFCKNYLSEYICVPYFQNIWPEWTNKTIDEIIEKEMIKNIENVFIEDVQDKDYHPEWMNEYLKYHTLLN